MRRIHLIVGLLGVLAFLITGQVMGHHSPNMQFLPSDVRMMYVSRGIYLLGPARAELTVVANAPKIEKLHKMPG